MYDGRLSTHQGVDRRLRADRQPVVVRDAAEGGAGPAMRIEPFEAAVGQERLDDLRARLRGTRWPDWAETEPWSEGADKTYLEELVAYWADGFDWRRQEARLNQSPPVPCRDRRTGGALHPRAGQGTEPAPADDHPRLARLGARDARADSPADTIPPRMAGTHSTPSTSSCPRSPATDSPTRLGDPAWIPPGWQVVARADDRWAGLPEVRRARRRLGRDGGNPDGHASAGGDGRDPSQLSPGILHSLVG